MDKDPVARSKALGCVTVRGPIAGTLIEGRGLVAIEGHRAEPVSLVVIQSTSFCNIDCSYCYLPDRGSKQRMTRETLSKIAERLFESPFIGEEVTVVWHAGEPLVVPVEFYEEAFDIFQSYSAGRASVIFSFQTNATLVSDRWCDFFVKIGARVGVSIDGPKALHDLHRVDRAGRGTYDRAMRGLYLLQAWGLRPHVIMVLTRSSLDRADAIWEFLVANKIDMVGFNPEEAEGINVSSSVHDDDSERAYRRFISRCLALRDASGVGPRVREIESATSVLQLHSNTARAQDNIPMAIINFDFDGNVSTFSPELLTATHQPYGRFVFGNVYQNALTEVLTDPKFQLVNQAIQDGVDQCRDTCDYYRFCGGGSPSNKMVELGNLAGTETRSCRLRIKVTVSSIADHLRASLQAPLVARVENG